MAKNFVLSYKNVHFTLTVVTFESAIAYFVLFFVVAVVVVRLTTIRSKRRGRGKEPAKLELS